MSEQPTPGMIAVGATFNPSGDERINKLKQLFADAFDIVERAVPADDGTLETARLRKMRDAALHEIVTAQMWAVKAIAMTFTQEAAPSDSVGVETEETAAEEVAE